MILVAAFYLLIPTLFISLIAFRRQPDLFNWITNVLSLGLSMVFLLTIARWEIVSIHFKSFFWVLLVVAVIFSFRRIKSPETPPKKIAYYITLSVNILLIFFMGVLNYLCFKGYPTPSNAIELSSPLKDGSYIVLHGGTSPFINAHAKIRPQNYALDIVGLNSLGMRASSITGGAKLEDYDIYGAAIYSPCNGIVLLTVDEFKDLTPPKTDPEHLAGNHVLIKCNDIEILLAHMKQGSILVQAGEMVNTNTILGQVGNTGNTSEPHLHMHAEQGGDPNTILNGKGVPFIISDRFLVRGSILK